MVYSKPVTDIIRARYSCRKYLEQPIKEQDRQALEHFMAAPQIGPFGTQSRFALVAATEQDRQALKGLATYGIIKGAPGFIIGAQKEQGKSLEDFGYLMERIILYATDIGLGTCWMGGTFNKSRFARKAEVGKDESVPAAVAVGYIGGDPQNDPIRRRARGERRLAWEKLFFDREFGAPLTREAAGPYLTPLEMVQRGPSASNNQPWRIVKDGNVYHLYIQRTAGYTHSPVARLIKLADMQRIDAGIAMSHFELVAGEAGLEGKWEVGEPGIARPDELTEYVASWVG